MVVSLSMLTVVSAVGLPPDKESKECWTEFLHDMCGAPSRCPTSTERRQNPGGAG
jgi:hypothetical protein